MSSINEYRDDLASLVTFPVPFKKGFDAAMDLRLPEKFADWMDIYTYKHNSEWFISGDANYKVFNILQLYSYWLNNVFNVQESDATEEPQR